MFDKIRMAIAKRIAPINVRVITFETRIPSPAIRPTRLPC